MRAITSCTVEDILPLSVTPIHVQFSAFFSKCYPELNNKTFIAFCKLYICLRDLYFKYLSWLVYCCMYIYRLHSCMTLLFSESNKCL